jgi:hypothetical protein
MKSPVIQQFGSIALSRWASFLLYGTDNIVLRFLFLVASYLDIPCADGGGEWFLYPIFPLDTHHIQTRQ